MDLPTPDSVKKWIETKDNHDRLLDSYITIIVGLLVSVIATTEEIQRLRLRAVARLDQMIARFREEEVAEQDETDLRQILAANKPPEAGEP